MCQNIELSQETVISQIAYPTLENRPSGTIYIIESVSRETKTGVYPAAGHVKYLYGIS